MGQVGNRVNTLVSMNLMVTRSGGQSSTVATAAVAAATTLVLVSGTGFLAGMDIHVGSDETQELVRIGSVSTNTLTLASALQFDHAVGDAVVETNALSIGLPEAAGLKINYNGENVDVFVATQRLAYGVLKGYVDLGGSFAFPTVTADSMAFALGIPRANVIGDGTAVAQTGTVGPRLFTTDGALFGSMSGVSMVAVIRLNNGNYTRLNLFNLTFDPTAYSVSFSRGQLSTIPVKFLASSATVDVTNSLWTPATTLSTYAPSSSDIFSEITGVQAFSASGTSTTTTGAITAGAYVIPVTSATGITVGCWVQLGTGDTAEFHKVRSITTLNVNLDTQVLAAQVSGVAVVVQTLTTVADVKGGFTLAVSGSVKTNRSELYRNSISYTVNNAAVAFSTKVGAFTSANLLLALGLPSSALASSIVSLGNLIGTSTATTLLFTGKTQGARNISICGWRGASVISGDFNLGAAVETELALQYKPAVLQMFVNA